MISNKHAHEPQASINNGNIFRSRQANHGKGNRGSHNGGKPTPSLRMANCLESIAKHGIRNQRKLVQEERTPTMANARKLLELIRDKHAHKQQANKNNSNISRSRRANHGGGNRNSHQGGNPMPSLKMATSKSTCHIAKHGLRAFKQTPAIRRGNGAIR